MGRRAGRSCAPWVRNALTIGDFPGRLRENMPNLNILPAEKCRWDGVALGEVMIRFDPGDVPFERARACRIWHGGGEVNVAEGLSYCFGLRTTILTALVDDGFGRNIANQIREAGVDIGHVIWFTPGGKGKYSTDKKGGLANGIN